MASPTPSSIKGSLNLSIGGSKPVEVATFDIPVEWTLDKSAYGWSASPNMSSLDATMKRIAAAVEQALSPSEATERVVDGEVTVTTGGGES